MILSAEQVQPLAKSSKSPAASTVKSNSTSKTKASQKPKSAGAQSKQDQVLTMLRRKDGATIAAVMQATGWQTHSVRGFFAGVVRKKLRLNLVSEESNGKRVYRITAGKHRNVARENGLKRVR